MNYLRGETMKARMLIGGLLAIGLVAGCGSPTAPSTGSTFTPPAETPSGAPLIEDDSTLPPATIPATPDEDAEAKATDTLFVALVKAKAPKLLGADDDSVVQLGKGICDEYDAGRTTTEIGLTLVATGLMDLPSAGYVIGVSTDSYCPKHNGE